MGRFTIRLIVLLIFAAFVLPALWFYQDQDQLFDEPALDSLAPELPADLTSPAILVFSKTNSYRHKRGIPAAQQRLREIAERAGWSVFFTENGAVHNPQQLARFDVLVWSHVSGRVLTEAQQAAMRAFIEGGGGFVGLHAAGDGSHRHWDWYQQQVLRADFIGHTLPPHSAADMVTVNKTHPVTAGLPAVWKHRDEWYAFEQSAAVKGAEVLVTVDESSYRTGKLTMPGEHSMVWAHPVGDGHVVYSALGHYPDSFDTPEYRQLLEQAIRWAGQLP